MANQWQAPDVPETCFLTTIFLLFGNKLLYIFQGCKRQRLERHNLQLGPSYPSTITGHVSNTRPSPFPVHKVPINPIHRPILKIRL